MGFSEPPSRARGGRARPVAPVTAGVRKRGRSGKLTPFIAIQEPTARVWFQFSGDSVPLLMLVGDNDDAGKIALMLARPGEENITLRRPAPGSTEFIVESTMIPIKELKQMRRLEAQFESPPAGVSGMIIRLPWAVQRLKAGEL